MKKRITLRALMIAVAVCAACLVPFRIYRQYRADRVQFQSLVATHKLMDQMRTDTAKLAEILERAERSSFPELSVMAQEIDSQRSDVMERSPIGVERDQLDGIINRATQIKSRLSSQVAVLRSDLAECTRKEAEARVAIEHWKATHFWF